MAQGFMLPMPRLKFTDVNNNPLAGGLLYGFISGTATPQTFYQNSDLSSAHTNPATLSSSGEITVFLPSATLYSFNLKDSAGNQQPGWPISGVEALPAPDPPAPTPSPVPAGGIVMYGGTSAPSGYLLCNGALVSRSTYSALFTAISTTFGAGDGSTTFAVPDLRQRFPLGVAASGTGNTLGGTGGTIDHTHTGPSHTHTSSVDVSHTHNVTVAAHQHNVTAPSNGWVGASTAPSVNTRIVLGDGATTYTQPTVDNVVASAANGAINQNTGAASISTVTPSIGSGGDGATGTANPAFVALNFLIKT